jgi:hypothetical protein
MMTNGVTEPPVKEKMCTQCGQLKPATLEHYYKDNKNADNLTTWCKVCRKASAKLASARLRDKKRNAKQQSVVVATPHIAPVVPPLLPLAPVIKAGDYYFNPAAVALYDCSPAGEIIVVMTTQETRLEPIPNTPHKAITVHPITFRIKDIEAVALRSALDNIAVPLKEDHSKDEQLYQEWDAADKRATVAEERVTELESELAAIKAKVEALFR